MMLEFGDSLIFIFIIIQELISFYFPSGTDDPWENMAAGSRMFSDWFFEYSKGFLLDSMAKNGESTYEFLFQPRCVYEDNFRRNDFCGHGLTYQSRVYIYF